MLSRLRVVSEALAYELKRCFPLDVITHGTATAELTEEWPRAEATVLVFDGSSSQSVQELRWVLRALQAPRAVVYGLGEALEDLRDCARVHVGALVSRDAAMSELAVAVEAVAAGKYYTSPSLIPGLMTLAAGTRTFVADDLSRLTDRERQVALMLSRGLTYAQIAIDLAVSPATVKNHAHNIYRKMRDTSRETERKVADDRRAQPR